MARFLSYPFTVPLQPIAHNVAPLCESVEGFIKAYRDEGMWGSIEMEGMIGWQIIRKELPDLKTVVVRRPLQEVYNSLVMKGYTPNLSGLAELNAMLDVIADQPDVFSLNSSDLDAPIACKWLFEYCLEIEFDFEWWHEISQMNIQVNIEEAQSLFGETSKRAALYQADVLKRMKEINNCLN
jgi:hypothetical protein